LGLSIIAGWLRAHRPSSKTIPKKHLQRLSQDPETQTRSEGGRLCDGCKTAKISFDDLYGHFEGGLFIVKGFRCPECGHCSGKTSHAQGVTKYDWRRLP